MLRTSIGLCFGLALSLAACEAEDPPAPEAALDRGQPAMANPASANCIDKGGTLQIEARGDGGEYGVCLFEDDGQCEEWALMRGQCPEGGVKVAGYATEAARYCAITGGTYQETGENSAGGEAGDCTLPDGTVCGAAAHYNGGC